MADPRAIFSEAVPLTVSPISSRVAIPAGVGRCAVFQLGLQSPIFIVFGAGAVIATPAGQRVDFGTSQFTIPDGTTNMAYISSGPTSTVLLQWGYIDIAGHAADPVAVPADPPLLAPVVEDDLASLFDPVPDAPPSEQP